VIRTLPLALYGAATGLLEPLAPGLLRGRARRGKEDPERLAERLGRASRERPPGPLAWLHGVSVGEATSLLPLVSALRAVRPDLTLLVTSGTTTAAALMARRLPDEVIHQYAPVDAPGAVRRFLDHWRPDLAVLVESELWPNLLLAARAHGVRLALLSARITEASAQGWSRWPASARALLSAFDLVLPQDAAAGARLERLGGQPGPELNLKRVGDPLPADPTELARLREAAAGRRIVLAASTHPGEETLVCAAFRQAVPDPSEALLVIAPRHPDRGEALARELGAGRRSAGDPLRGAIHIADTLGELGLFFRLADVVVMGGAFAPGIGGHNPLEPARIGRPILTGPHAFNAADVYTELLAEAAAIEATSADDLARHIRGLIDYPAIARRMGEAALAYANRQGAALDQALALLQPLLPA
jgi:3-deoxy-D-manno-octulosonic-acid transferase